MALQWAALGEVNVAVSSRDYEKALEILEPDELYALSENNDEIVTMITTRMMTMTLNNTLTDVPGILVGHQTHLDGATGCTVIICPAWYGRWRRSTWRRTRNARNRFTYARCTLSMR